MMKQGASALVIALDRSGSMTGAPREAAEDVVATWVRRCVLEGEVFGLVAFDHTAELVVPAARWRDPEGVLAQLVDLRAGEGSDLGAGYLRALREVVRVCDDRAGAVGRVLVVSDGRANRGITTPAGLGRVARQAHAEGIVTSTVGCGGSCDADLLAGLARDGAGSSTVARAC